MIQRRFNNNRVKLWNMSATDIQRQNYFEWRSTGKGWISLYLPQKNIGTFAVELFKIKNSISTAIFLYIFGRNGKS